MYPLYFDALVLTQVKILSPATTFPKFLSLTSRSTSTYAISHCLLALDGLSPIKWRFTLLEVTFQAGLCMQLLHMETALRKHKHKHPHWVSATWFPAMTNVIHSLRGKSLQTSKSARHSFVPSHCLFANITRTAPVILPPNKWHKINPKSRKKTLAC